MNLSINDFIYTLVHKYSIPLMDIYGCANDENEEFKKINTIFQFTTSRQKELCLALISMISIKNNHSILKEFKDENQLSQDEYTHFISKECIDANKALLVAGILYNNQFANRALLLCSLLGRKVLEKKEDYIELIHQSGSNIRHVPHEYLADNQELGQIAINRSRAAFQYIKEPDFELCILAAKKYPYVTLEQLHANWPVSFTKSQICSICETAVQNNGLCLKFIIKKTNWEQFSPAERIKLCYIAVESDALALQYIPKELQSKDICEKAILKNSRAYNFIPRNDDWFEELTQLTENQEMIEDKLDKSKIVLAEHHLEYYQDNKKKEIEIFGTVKNLNQLEIVLPEFMTIKGYQQNYKENSFANKGLKVITFPINAKKLEDNSFINNPIKEIIWMNKPTEIGEHAFDYGKIIFPVTDLKSGQCYKTCFPENITVIEEIKKAG